MKRAILFLFASALLPAQVLAQESPETVLVLDIALNIQDAGQEQYQSVAALLTDRLRAEIAAVEGWEVSPTRATTREARQAQGCDDEFQSTVCFRQIADAAGVGHVVFGTLRPHTPQEPNPFTITLSRYERASDRFAGSTYRTIRTDGPPEEIAARIQQIVGEDDLHIRPRQPTPPRSQPSEQHPTGDRDLFVGLGIGSLALSLGSFIGMIGSWVRISDIQNDTDFVAYRSQPWPPGTSDVCREAGHDSATQAERIRGLCDEASVFDGLQWVFLSTSLAFAALGVTLMVLDLGGSQEPLVLQPSAGPDGASLRATYRF